MSFRPGDVLLSEGAHDRHAYLLISGFVKVTATLENVDHDLRIRETELARQFRAELDARAARILEVRG